MLTTLDNAAYEIAKSLAARPEFSLVPRSELEISAGKMIVSLKTRFLTRIEAEDTPLTQERIDAALKDACAKPLETINKDGRFALRATFVPGAVKASQLKHGAPKEAPRFRYLFNPGEISPYIFRIEMKQKKIKDVSLPEMMAAVKDGSFAELASHAKTSNLYNRVVNSLMRRMLYDEALEPQDAQDKLALLDALSAACKSDESLGEKQREQYIRSLDRLKGVLSPQPRLP